MHSRTLGWSGVELGDVRERPLEPCLQDDADVLVPVLAQAAIEGERVVGAGRVLHVDPHEVVARSRVADEPFEQRAADLDVELETEGSELHAHVRVEPVAIDCREHVGVGVGDRLRLLGAGDLLPEHVDGRELPRGVQ